MRLSILLIAAILLFSYSLMAQHSGGSSSGGSSGGSSAGSSGGGSHSSSSSGGGYSGGGGGHVSGESSTSSGGHSSSGAPSHESGSHNSSRGTNSALASHSGERNFISTETRQNRLLNPNSQLRTAQPEKRTFFSFLRHPFRKPLTKSAVYLPRPICPKGHCDFCPPGVLRMGSACVGGTVPLYQNNYCFQGHGWIGGSCLAHNTFLADCSAVRLAMERQAQRMQTAESIRQSACLSGGSAACSTADQDWQSEQSLYRTWADRYRRCRSSAFAYRFTGLGYPGSGRGASFDPLRLDLDY
jgi:hypothetical protein